MDKVDGMIKLTVDSNVSLDAKGTKLLKSQCHTDLSVQFNYGSSLLSRASPSYPERVWSKDCTNASGWNAIIDNSGMYKIETNCHFRTVCIR